MLKLRSQLTVVDGNMQYTLKAILILGKSSLHRCCNRSNAFDFSLISVTNCLKAEVPDETGIPLTKTSHISMHEFNKDTFINHLKFVGPI